MRNKGCGENIKNNANEAALREKTNNGLGQMTEKYNEREEWMNEFRQDNEYASTIK